MAEDSTLPHKLTSAPMIHGVEGVAELVWESGQPQLARHPSRNSRLLLSGKRPRLGANDQRSFEPMWVEPHVVPEYKDPLDHHPYSAAAFNTELVPKVPDPATEFNVGWGPFAQMLTDNANHRQQGTHSCSTNSSSRLDRLMQGQKSSSVSVESTLVESGSISVKALETQFDLLATGAAAPDEQSEAVSRDSERRAKRARMEASGDENPDHRRESVCSLAASNDFEHLETTHTTGMAQRGRKKKRRSAEVHNQSEKRRRAKINKKLQVLQDMIPNANKVDKASLLDEAIEYMKGLQLQLQVMAMGRGFMMHPMMLPGFQAPQMAQPPSIGMGMGMAMGMNTPMGLGCNPSPLSNSPLLSFPGQMLPLSMPQLQPFSAMPTGGSSSKPSIPMPAVDELLRSAPPFVVGTGDTARGTNPEMLKMEGRKDG